VVQFRGEIAGFFEIIPCYYRIAPQWSWLMACVWNGMEVVRTLSYGVHRGSSLLGKKGNVPPARQVVSWVET